jgi:hypothetical protein
MAGDFVLNRHCNLIDCHLYRTGGGLWLLWTLRFDPLDHARCGVLVLHEALLRP